METGSSLHRPTRSRSDSTRTPVFAQRILYHCNTYNFSASRGQICDKRNGNRIRRCPHTPIHSPGSSDTSSFWDRMVFYDRDGISENRRYPLIIKNYQRLFRAT